MTEYEQYAKKILEALGIPVPDPIFREGWYETEDIDFKNVKVSVKVHNYFKSQDVHAELTVILPEEGAVANAFLKYCAEKENLAQYRGHYGIDDKTTTYSPWNNNFLCIESRGYEIPELDKAVDRLIILGKKILSHLDEYRNIRRWETTDKEVIEKAHEIVKGAELYETDVDREERAHYIRDRKSFIHGWFMPFNDNGKGTFDTLWPSSVDYAASSMGFIQGSFEYAVACLVLINKEYIAKARKACKIRKEKVKIIY